MSTAGNSPTHFKSRSIVLVDLGVAFGGAVVSGATLCNGLAELGHRVTLVSAMPVEEVKHLAKPQVAVRSERQRMDYLTWRQWNDDRRDTRGPRWLLRILGYVAVLYQIALNLPFAWRIAKICRDSDADILHANNGTDLPTAIASVLARACMVVHLRGPYLDSLIDRTARRRSRLFIAISDYVLEESVKRKVSAKLSVLQYNPVEAVRPSDDEIARCREVFGAAPGVFLIGGVGRFVPWKGQLELLRAIAPLLRETEDVRLALVGDGADGGEGYAAELHAWVRDNGLESKVCFAGFRRDIETVYAAIDLMVHTAIAPEPFGRVIVEAMLQGAPVIAASSGGPLEIIDDGVDGLLRDPTDEVSLREAIRSMYVDRELRSRIAKAGEAMARRRFGARANAERVSGLYERVLNRQPIVD